MSNWLAENAALIYMLLGVATVVLGFAWWQTKRGWFAVGSGVLVLLIILVWLFRTFYPSDAELMMAKIEEMAAAVKTGNLDRMFAPVSNDFRFRGLDKAEFRSFAEQTMRSHDVTEVRVWGFQSEGAAKNRTGKISFQFKPKGNWADSTSFYLCEAEFALENDGQWRLRSCEVFNPFVQQHAPLGIPGLPAPRR